MTDKMNEPSPLTSEWLLKQPHDSIIDDFGNSYSTATAKDWDLRNSNITRYSFMENGVRKVRWDLYICHLSEEEDKEYNSIPYYYPRCHSLVGAAGYSLAGEPSLGNTYALIAKYDSIDKAVAAYNNINWDTINERFCAYPKEICV